MKKIFRNIGIITIICLSFIMSEKTAIVVKDIDSDSIELKKIEKEYYEETKNAIIKGNTIIPGKYGKKLNINKTYKEIKKIGIINENYFIYDYIKPEISLEDNYDKYIISGNQENHNISLIFIIKNNDNVNQVLKILEKEQIKTTFFVEENWFKQNNQIIEKITKKGNKIEKLFDDNKTSVNQNRNKKNIDFCFTETENETLLNKCQKEHKHTIKQKIISNTNPLIEIKKQITNGSIIALTINENVKKELELIIKYIKSKGYKIERLEELLSEKMK